MWSPSTGFNVNDMIVSGHTTKLMGKLTCGRIWAVFGLYSLLQLWPINLEQSFGAAYMCFKNIILLLFSPMLFVNESKNPMHSALRYIYYTATRRLLLVTHSWQHRCALPDAFAHVLSDCPALGSNAQFHVIGKRIGVAFREVGYYMLTQGLCCDECCIYGCCISPQGQIGGYPHE